MHIVVLNLSENEKKGLDIFHWPVSTLEKNLFAWHHQHKEECYILEGEAIDTLADGSKISFKAGDFVIFPKGVTCICQIKQPIRRHCRTLS